ncbi:MAG: hypothetical protein WCP03_01280 [Candidatus Saccharibacteria bacterium]
MAIYVSSPKIETSLEGLGLDCAEVAEAITTHIGCVAAVRPYSDHIVVVMDEGCGDMERLIRELDKIKLQLFRPVAIGRRVRSIVSNVTVVDGNIEICFKELASWLHGASLCSVLATLRQHFSIELVELDHERGVMKITPKRLDRLEAVRLRVVKVLETKARLVRVQLPQD